MRKPTDKDMNDQSFRLLLVDLPPGTSAQHIGFARPLGERAAVIARLVELLPGTTFNPEGRGSFKCATYEITVTLVEPEPHSIEVEVDHHEGFVALKRLVAKTGWQMIDPVGGTFVDIEASVASAGVGASVPLTTSASDSAPSTTTVRYRQNRIRRLTTPAPQRQAICRALRSRYQPKSRPGQSQRCSRSCRRCSTRRSGEAG